MRKGFKIACCIIVLIVALVLCCGSVITLGATGLVPAISSVFKMNKPRDLGIAYTQEDYARARMKIGIVVAETEDTGVPGESLKYSGTKEIDEEFSSSEMTALLAEDHWIYNPISEIQVKIGNDGTAEVSGMLDLNTVEGYALALGFDDADIQNAKDTYKVKDKVPFYARGTAEVVDNQLTLDIRKFEVYRVPVPGNIIDDAHDRVVSFIEERLNGIPGLDVKKFEMKDGKVFIQGTVPAEKSIAVE